MARALRRMYFSFFSGLVSGEEVLEDAGTDEGDFGEVEERALCTKSAE